MLDHTTGQLQRWAVSPWSELSQYFDIFYFEKSNETWKEQFTKLEEDQRDSNKP